MKSNRSHLSEAIMNMKNLAGIAAVVGLAAVATGCGDAIDINRVGPNAVEKKLLDGEWYYRATVVDKQYGTYDTFTGSEGGLERIKWEITENKLIGYRSYERVPGSDPSDPGEQNVIVEFPILKHFDIKRQYNPINGVESNVIEENDYDRPWYERDYVRVGWNSNDARGLDIGTVNASGGVVVDAVQRNSNETPNYPWKVRISDNYIESTIDGFRPADRYVCYYLDGVSPCNGASVKTKLSFLRVPQDNDYQALDYPDYIENVTGNTVIVGTNEPVLTSTSNDFGPFVRPCLRAEMGQDGTSTMLVKFDVTNAGAGITDGARTCNTDTGALGDDPADCTEVTVTCDTAGSDNLVAVTPGNGSACDPNHHSPDDCVELTTTVFSRFGFFRTDRFQVDRENGSQYNSRERLINRHNIWAKSIADDGKVIPLGRRPVKPIIYYLNVGFPTDLLDATTKTLADNWNSAFMDAVATARGVETSELPENLNEGFDGFPKVTRMFEIRQNSCNLDSANAYADEHDMRGDLAENGIASIAYGNLEESCAVLEFASKARADNGEDIDVFTWEQLGDLRYNFLNWVAKAELAGPLGYGPSASDPLTGEIISSNANIYGASLDTYANWGADIVQLLQGEITEGDIINGTVAREHVEGVRARWAKKLSKEKVDGFLRLFDQRANRMSDNDYFVRLPTTALNRGLDKLKASGLEEEMLMTTETFRLFGNDARSLRDGRITPSMLENARPSNWAREHVPQQMLVAANAGNAGSLADAPFTLPNEEASKLSPQGKLEELSDYLGRKNFCFLSAQVEPAVADLAAHLTDKSREEVVKTIREQVFIGVTAHELGHTFGLRHNFEGSADALNFFPQYWGVGADGLRPQNQDLLGLQGDTPRQSELMYSTVMDYHQRFNSDWNGIGLYDRAAIKLGYAESVEVFDESEGEFVARDWINQTFLLDPQDYPKLVGGRDNDGSIDRLFADAYEAAAGGDETALLDIKGAATVPAAPQNLFKRKAIPIKQWIHEELLQSFTRGLDDSECGDFNVREQQGCMEFFLNSSGLNSDDGHLAKVTVPYSFCSDEFAFGGNLTCNRYDMGATSSEIVKNAGEMYEFYYPFDAFRRDRVLNPFTSWAGGYMNRLYSRTYQPMLNAYRYFYYYRRAQTLRVYPTIRDWGTAALQGMDFFVRVLQQPEPGKYCKQGDTYVAEADATDCTDSVNIGLDQGRVFHSNWDSEYDFRPINLGNYWDKVLALQAITSSDAFFFRDFSQETNRGAFSIGYYRIFQNEMLDLFGAVMRNDTSVFAPHVADTDGDGKAEVLYQPFLKTGIYGEPLPDDGASEGDPVVPATSYQLRNYAAIFGMINMTSTLDQTLDFAQRARVTIEGQAGDPTIDLDIDGDGTDDLQQAVFEDPISRLTYRSAATNDEAHSVSGKLLEDANAFKTATWEPAKAALDAAEAGTDEAAKRAARVEFDRANNKLQEKIQIIDFMVYLGDVFEYAGG